jgi:hypothetical protein
MIMSPYLLQSDWFADGGTLNENRLAMFLPSPAFAVRMLFLPILLKHTKPLLIP